MQATCVRYTDLPGTTALFADYLYRFDRVSRFYDHCPHELECYQGSAARVDFPAERRAALIEALRAMNGDHPALEELAKPGTYAVVTGQQVGLFSGPAYTIYKALTAVALARRLTAAGLPSVPIFWLATEDHDFTEVNHAWVFDAANRPVRLEMPANGAGKRPVGGIGIEQAPIDELHRALSGFAYGDDVADTVARAYASGETMGSAFSKLLTQVLGPNALPVFDPMHPAGRRLAAPLLSRAVERMPELNASVRERSRELIDAGYHAQVHVEEQTSFVFLLENGQRLALHRHDREFVLNGRRLSASELAAKGEQLSPNALLRPVAQDWMLPTIAYVGGPAELAYLAQSQVLYHELLGRMPVAVPRQAATLLDHRAAKLFDRYHLTLADFFHGEEGLRDRIASRLVPPEVSHTIESARARSAEIHDGVSATLARFDPSLEAAFAKSRRKMEYQLEKTARKAARAALLRNERACQEAAYLAGLVYPEKHLQERLYSILPFLARHGMDLASRLEEDIKPDCMDHRLIVL
jgi:bacillithiol biosynthesis cysteine-adding enzyme BshC